MRMIGSRAERIKATLLYALTSRKKYLQDRSKYLGLKRYKYTEKEHATILKLAQRLNCGKDIIDGLHYHYNNIHAVNVPRLISRGKFNAFIGIFHDASLRKLICG